MPAAPCSYSWAGRGLARGSRRWIGPLGFSLFQPSEFGKLLVVVALAGYLADRYRRVLWGAGLDDDRTLAADGAGSMELDIISSFV